MISAPLSTARHEVEDVMTRIETIRDQLNKIRTPFLYTNDHEDINISVGLRRATDLCDDLYATLWRASEDIHAHEVRGGPWVPSASDDDGDTSDLSFDD